MRVETAISTTGPDDGGAVTIEVRLDVVEGSLVPEDDGHVFEIGVTVFCGELQFERSEGDPGGLMGHGTIRLLAGVEAVPCRMSARVKPDSVREDGVIPLLATFSQGTRHGWSTKAHSRASDASRS